MITDMDVIFNEMKRVLTLFLDIVYKLKSNDLKVRNVVFTRCLEEVGSDLDELYNDKLIVENGVGLKIRARENKTDNVLVYSYFVDEKRLQNFIYKLDEEIDSLYNIWI